MTAIEAARIYAEFVGGETDHADGPTRPPMSGVMDHKTTRVTYFGRKLSESAKDFVCRMQIERQQKWVQVTFSKEYEISVAPPPTSNRPIPLSALRHDRQRIGLFVPRGR